MSQVILLRTKNTEDIYIANKTETIDDVLREIRCGDFDSTDPSDYEYMVLEFQPTHVLSPETLKPAKPAKAEKAAPAKPAKKSKR